MIGKERPEKAPSPSGWSGRENRVRDNIVANGLKVDEGAGVVRNND